MSFQKDNKFSLHKDELLSKYWEEISFKGRFVLSYSRELQLNLGVDVVLQKKIRGKITDLLVDTKHIRGIYNRIYCEEMSCPETGKLGWILKTPSYTHYVFYCFWPQCKGCDTFPNCHKCKDVLDTIIYVLDFPKLKAWFIENKENYTFSQNKKTKDNFNATTGRLVPIEVLKKEKIMVRRKEIHGLNKRIKTEITRYRTSKKYNYVSDGDMFFTPKYITPSFI